jgi:ubiquinone/menaquinone biosynthesis C-methylase UbiE
MPFVHRGTTARFAVTFLAGLLAAAALPARAQEAEGQSRSNPKPKAKAGRSDSKPSRTERRAKSGRDRRGFYMGRQIADVMSWQGVDWLFRETRIEEEQPEAMLDALKIRPGATVADVGAGAGYHSIRLARRVGPEGTVLATDIQPEMIQLLKQNALAAGVTNITPLLCSQHDTRLPEGKVDLILMVDVYHECTDPETILLGLKKALRPAGRLVLVEFRGEDPDVPIKPEHKMTLRQVRREVEPQGFTFKTSLEFLPWQHVIIFEKPAEKAENAPDPVTGFVVHEDHQRIQISGANLEASIRKKGYVTGIEAQSFLDKKTGFRDQGFGLDIVDWIMEPGSDEADRDRLPADLVYRFNNAYHGKRPKRSIEGPQICTQAKELSPRVIRGKDFVAIEQGYTYHLAAPGKKTGSRWDQTIVFPAGKRYFLSCDRITTVNGGDALFLRVDMPGHIRHRKGDTFSEIYLSYHGRIPAHEFVREFPPDDRFLYVRNEAALPRRMIRAYHLRDSATGKNGPWLAGMTLDPSVVSEAWCHQRGYVCMIEEFGGRPIRPGGVFSAAFLVGFFDSLDEMTHVYDLYAGGSSLKVDERGWTLEGSLQRPQAGDKKTSRGRRTGNLLGS